MFTVIPVGVAGGGAVLNVTAYGAVGNLPASAAEGAVAVITSTAIGDVYVSTANPGTKSSGAIWVFIGANALANIDIGNNILLPPRAIYQSNGSSWVLLESYVYTSSAWVEITMYLYYYGNEILATWTKNYGGGSFVKQATYLDFIGSAGADTDAAIDFTDIDTIRIVCQCNTDTSFNYARLTPGNLAQVTFANDGVQYTRTMDVSSISGTYYMDLYFISNEGERHSYVRSILLEH